MEQVQVSKADIADAAIVAMVPGALRDGWVRLSVDSFSVTANNVTYAVVGDGFGYWDFFPAPEGKGIVPMWGHATVIESAHPEIAAGERVYGYLPMGSHLDVQPGKIVPGGFTDMAEHRQPMSPIYNRYSRLAADPEHDPAREGERMIFGPLFRTGFLIEYFMRSQDWFGVEQLIVTSASSKTAMGLASVACDRSPGIRRVGLTSAGNVGFVEDSGLYDQVLSYEQIDKLADAPSVSVDFAGNGEMLRSIHAALDDMLRYSCLVGVTHIDAREGGPGSAQDLPGPQPILFFAPDHALALFEELGPAEAGAQIAQSWRGFLDDAAGSVAIERRKGLGAARDAFTAMVRGKVDPSIGIVIEP